MNQVPTTDIRVEIHGATSEVILPIYTLVELVMRVIGDDKAKVREFISFFAWKNEIREITIERLKDEFASTHYNPSIHEERQQLMQAMGVKEVYYLASELAGKIEDGQREQRDYWKLYHAVMDHRRETDCRAFDGFTPPEHSKIDFDARRACEKLLEPVLTSALPKSTQPEVHP